ncbi:methyltransferase domain-containing protein [soil metagenome]
MNVEAEVMARYSEGARGRQESLCCPVAYDRDLLALLPDEIVERDYGCGDPTRYVRTGDAVLDLGSGAGKLCYLMAHRVGREGRIIGVDMNAEMLGLARKYRGEMAAKLGGDRVRFVKARIQDLALDLEAVEEYLATRPVHSLSDLQDFESWQRKMRSADPLIPDASVDLVVSNCVLNLVRDQDKLQLIREIFRVLKPGGRVAISDIVCDEPVPAVLKEDPMLWSGCVSGAFQEEEMLAAFTDAGFLAVRYDQWGQEPWRVIAGIEFRAVTLTAIKGEGTPCLDVGQAVIYQGPYASVSDDEGHLYPRGARIAVCERTYRLLTAGPYREDFIGINPGIPRAAVPWCAPAGTRRPAAETKGAAVTIASAAPGCC